MCESLLRFPMKYYRLSVFIFVEGRDSLMYCTQDVSIF